MQEDLFRRAAVENQARRLHGDIVLQSSISSKLLTLAIVTITGLAIVWVVLARYARTEAAKGIIVPVAGLSKIYAIRPGVISSLMVKEGDLVKAGQKIALITLENRNAAGAFGTIEALDSLQEQRVIADEQINLSRQRSNTDLSRLGQIIQGLRAQEATIKEQIELQQQVVTSTTTTFDQLGAVVEKGFVSKLEYERRRQGALAAKQELSRLNQQMAATQSDIVRTDHERTGLQLDGRSQQATARSAIEELRQQRSRVTGEASYLIEAPVSGRVTAIQTGIGQTVGSTMPMMIVMPEGAQLRADIYVPSRAIGFIKAGQEVRLLYDAFPYQRFGSFGARVATISRVAIAGTEANAPFKIDEPVYRITAVPTLQSVSAYGKPVALQPGMTLVANIVLERQTFLDWFLSPLRAVANRN